MRSFVGRRAAKAGMPPGSVVFTGVRKVEHALADRISYDRDLLDERYGLPPAEALTERPAGRVTWLNLVGVHDTEAIEALGEAFGLHPLVLEDLVGTGQRPKVEGYDGYLFVVLRMLSLDGGDELVDEQVSLILGGNHVLTVQERTGDVFEPLRERLRRGRVRLRGSGADYLAYALLDVLVDAYFALLERYGELLEALEVDILADPKPDALGRINALRQDLLLMRRAVWPLREVMSALQRDESPLLQEATRTYLRDVYDHVVQVIDTIETFRELLSGMHDTYLSNLSHRMNEIMKVLTIISTIFIPLGFLVGVYGTNFENIPELRWRWSYPLLWLVMLTVVGSMLAYFRRRRWL